MKRISISPFATLSKIVLIIFTLFEVKSLFSDKTDYGLSEVWTKINENYRIYRECWNQIDWMSLMNEKTLVSGYGVSKVVSPYHGVAPVYGGYGAYGVSKVVSPVATLGMYAISSKKCNQIII